MCTLAGKEWIGNLDFVQTKAGWMTTRWVLISAGEFCLAAQQGCCSHSTYFHGGEKWKCYGSLSGKTEEDGGLPCPPPCAYTPHTVVLYPTLKCRAEEECRGISAL